MHDLTAPQFAATAVKAEMIEFLVKQKAETDVEDQDHLYVTSHSALCAIS